MNFLTNLGVIGILCRFSLVLERKVGTKKHQSSKIDLWERISENNTALSDVKDNTFGAVTRGCIADLLLLRTLLTSLKTLKKTL